MRELRAGGVLPRGACTTKQLRKHRAAAKAAIGLACLQEYAAHLLICGQLLRLLLHAMPTVTHGNSSCLPGMHGVGQCGT